MRRTRTDIPPSKDEMLTAELSTLWPSAGADSWESHPCDSPDVQERDTSSKRILRARKAGLAAGSVSDGVVRHITGFTSARVGVHIRPALPSEAPLLCDIEEEVWGDPATTVQDMSILIRFGRVLVAERDTVLGALCAIHTAEGMYVEDWFVHPDYQGEGIGRCLYEAFLRDINYPVEALVEQDNEVSVAVHLKLGFREVGLIPDALCLGPDFILLRYDPILG